MTSDSKADYKYSAIDRPIAKATDAPSTCSEGELRCINGHCITISQLCDKVLFNYLFHLFSNCIYCSMQYIAWCLYANGKISH